MTLLNGSIVYDHPSVTNRYLRFTYKDLSHILQSENSIYERIYINVIKEYV